MSEPTQILVPWSGGADSTLALMLALAKYPKITRAMVVDCTNFPRKQFKGEARARLHAHAFLVSKFELPKHWLFTVKLDYPALDMGSWSVGQAVALHQAASMAVKDGGEIWWGSIRSDDFWTYYDRYANLHTALKGVMDKDYKNFFPLMHKKKFEVLDDLKAFGVTEKMRWSCSQNSTRPCQKCDSCITEALAHVERDLTPKGGVKP